MDYPFKTFQRSSEITEQNASNCIPASDVSTVVILVYLNKKGVLLLLFFCTRFEICSEGPLSLRKVPVFWLVQQGLP